MENLLHVFEFRLMPIITWVSLSRAPLTYGNLFGLFGLIGLKGKKLGIPRVFAVQ